MDEDPLQRKIYFLTFVELLEMIFSKYTETCEVLKKGTASSIDLIPIRTKTPEPTLLTRSTEFTEEILMRTYRMTLT